MHLFKERFVVSIVVVACVLAGTGVTLLLAYPSGKNMVSGSDLNWVQYSNGGRRRLAEKEEMNDSGGGGMRYVGGKNGVIPMESATASLPIDSSILDLARRGIGLPDRSFVEVGAAPHSFIRYSAYRFNLTSFYVIGLASFPLLKERGSPISGCFWLPANITDIEEGQTVKGKVRGFIADESHKGILYDALDIQCTFSEVVGGDMGGFLFLQLKEDTDSRSIYQQPPVLVLHEPSLNRTLYDFKDANDKKNTVEYVHCTAPIFSDVHAMRMKEFIQYYYVLYEKSAHFVLYNAGGFGHEMWQTLNPLIDAKVVTVIDLLEAEKYQTWFHHQALALSDCVHGLGFYARWVANFDFDEYLFVQPPSTLRGFLDEHKNYDSISFGGYIYSITQCVGNADEFTWSVERMIYRTEKPYCNHAIERFQHREELCESVHGRRKWLANSARVVVPAVHLVREPQAHKFVTNTSVVRFAHFRRLMNKAQRLCREWHTLEEEVVDDKYSTWGCIKFVRDTSLRDAGGPARLQLNGRFDSWGRGRRERIAEDLTDGVEQQGCKWDKDLVRAA